MYMFMKGRETRFLTGWPSLILLVIIGCLLVGGVKTAAAAETSRAAKVESVTGTVQIKKAGGTKAYKAFKSMGLNQGDLITTGAKSSIVLTMDQGSEVTVSENTVVYLSELQEAVNGKKTTLKAWSGSVYIKAKPLTKKGDSFQISTPTAVMGVRGTQFLTSIDPLTGSSSVFVGSGIVAADSLEHRDNHQVYPGMIGTIFLPRPADGTSMPESMASVVLPDDILPSLSPAVIEALIRNKLMMDEENDQFIQRLNQTLSPEVSKSLQLQSQDDLGRYQQNVDDFLNALIVKAVEEGKVSQEQLADLIQKANEGLTRKIDLDHVPGLDLTTQQEAERKKYLAMIEKQKKLAELEEKKKQEMLTNNASLISQMQEALDRLNQLNQEENLKKKQEAIEQLLNQKPASPGSTTGSSGGSGSGGSSGGSGSGGSGSGGGSGGGGSGGSGGDDKEDATIESIHPLSLETQLLKSYSLPATVQAIMSTGSKTTVPVSWNKKADTSLTGFFPFEGTVKGYTPKVQATLKVVAPLGSPVPLVQQRLLFEKGIVLDFGSMNVPSKATATLQPISPALPADGTLSNAGPIIDFEFSGVEIKEPVTISFPVDAKADEVGIFHWNGTDDWEYVPTTVSAGVATATVNHFSAYGVLQAPQVADVIAEPSEGLVDIGTAISLSSETPGATIYVKRGGSFQKYALGDRLTVPGDEETIEAYAAKRNMRDSDTVRFRYSTASASVIDSQHISVHFSQPVSVSSYDISIPGLPIAAAEQNGNSGLTITLGVDTAEMPIQSYTVMFYEGSRYVAQTNSFQLGKVPPPPPPPPSVDDIEIELEDVFMQTGEFSWDLIEDASDYLVYLNGEQIEEPSLYHDTDMMKSLLSVYRLKPGKDFSLKVQALDAQGKTIAEGTLDFSTQPLSGITITVLEKDANSIKVTWDPASYNRSYRFYLNDDETEINSIYFNDDMELPFEYTFEGLYPDTEYTLYVKEWPDDWPVAGGSLIVKTESGETPPPTIEFSMQPGEFTDGNQEFYWDTLPDADSYVVIQNGEEQPGATVEDNAGISSMTLSGFEPSIEYQVSVAVYNAAGDLIAEGTCSFTPVEPAGSEPDPTDPGTSEPDPTDPGTSEPDPTDPGTSEPDPTDPGTTDPDTTEPDPTDPGTEDPGTQLV